MRIIDTPPDTAEADEFLSTLGLAGIYASNWYSEFLLRAVAGSPLCLVAREGGKLVGLLRFFRVEHPKYGVVFNSLPWFGGYGGCAMAPGAPEATRSLLLEAFHDIVMAERTLFSATLISPPYEYAHINNYESSLSPSVRDERITQSLFFPRHPTDAAETILQRLDSRHRWALRKSQKQGFVYSEEDDDGAWHFLIATHKENMEAKSGKQKPAGHITALREQIPAGRRTLSVARLDGEPAAALLTLHIPKATSYIIPVIKAKFRSMQPMTFVTFERLRRAVDAGCLVWDFGPTPIGEASLHRFKARWGAEDCSYRYMTVCRDEAAAKAMIEERDAIITAFPNYYLYPY